MAASGQPVVRFGRTISPLLESALTEGGPLRWLVERANGENRLLDLQLRSSTGATSWVSLYAGLTKVLDVRELHGAFSFDVHATHRAVGAFEADWTVARPIERLAEESDLIEAYVDRILAPGGVKARFTDGEGRVQSAISRARSDHFGCFQREAVPSFASESIKQAIVAPISERIWTAMTGREGAPGWWPGVRDGGQRPRSDLEADLLAVDRDGRLLVVEVKPADELKGIAWAPGQARLYAELFARLLDVDPSARTEMIAMIHQRQRLGLPGPRWELGEQPMLRVVPVIAIGAGPQSSVAVERLREVHEALQRLPPESARVDPLEVWHHDETGQRTSHWRPDFDEPPSVADGKTKLRHTPSVPSTAVASTETLDPSERIDTIAGDPELTRWRRAARRHQHRWREAHGWPPGVQFRSARQGGGHRPIGSRLDAEFARSTGANFLTDDVRRAVEARLETPQRHQTLDPNRLRHDLLSSMPMCFNLFGPLWATPELASSVTHRWFPDLCSADSSVDVGFEWSPGRRDPAYLGDRTAFDDVLRTHGPDGPTLIGIETKYHEAPERPSKARPMPSRYAEVTERAQLFESEQWADHVWGTRLEQIWRDHLLALACRQHPNGPPTVRYVLVAPNGNPAWRPLAEEYNSLLTDEARSTFEYRSLEDLIDTASNLLRHAAAFRTRYLDVDLTDL